LRGLHVARVLPYVALNYRHLPRNAAAGCDMGCDMADADLSFCCSLVSGTGMALTDREWRSFSTCAHMLAKTPLSPPEDEIKQELLHRFWLWEFGSVRHPVNALEGCPEQDKDGKPYCLLSPEDMQAAYQMYVHGKRSQAELARTPYGSFDAEYRQAYLDKIELRTTAVACVMLDGKPILPEIKCPYVNCSKKEAELLCKEWLRTCIQQNPERPHTKKYFQELAMKGIGGLGVRAFLRAWAEATCDVPEWRQPGPPSGVAKDQNVSNL
jgi:hypothetical protein